MRNKVSFGTLQILLGFATHHLIGERLDEPTLEAPTHPNVGELNQRAIVGVTVTKRCFGTTPHAIELGSAFEVSMFHLERCNFWAHHVITLRHTVWWVGRRAHGVQI